MKKLRSALALAALLCAPHVLAAEPVTLLTEEYAPYAWTGRDGKVKGISFDVVAEIFKRAGVASSAPRILPWARAISIAERSADTCIYTMARTPERELLFKWIGPIAHIEWVLFARSADKIVIRDIDDARRYTIGTYIADASVALLRKHQLKVELASSDRANPQKLKLGRIDLWAVGQTPGLELMKQMGIKGMTPVYTLARTDMFLACHKSMDDAAVERLNDALRSMYDDDTIGAIYRRHGHASLAPRLQPPASLPGDGPGRGR